MAGRLDQRTRRDPQILLPFLLPALSHCHAEFYASTHRAAIPWRRDFYHGLLGETGNRNGGRVGDRLPQSHW
jgi:hypothetical protein